jgi:hypothetical protein
MENKFELKPGEIIETYSGCRYMILKRRRIEVDHYKHYRTRMLKDANNKIVYKKIDLYIYDCDIECGHVKILTRE